MSKSRNLADFANSYDGVLYEEGTWTPVTPSGSWTVANADYVRIGNLVICSCQLNATSTVSAADFTGLPFAAASGVDMGGSVTFQNEATGEGWAVLVQGTPNIWNWRFGGAQQGLSNGNTIYCTFSYLTS